MNDQVKHQAAKVVSRCFSLHSSLSGRLLFALLVMIVLTLPLLGRGKAAAEQEALPVCASVFKGISDASLQESELRHAAEKELHALGENCVKASADDAAFQMESALRRTGYPFSTVDFNFEKNQSETIVTFLVSAGPRTTITSLDISGNSRFTHDELLAFFSGGDREALAAGKLPFVEAQIRGVASEVKNFYYSQGFLEMRTAALEIMFSPDRTEVRVKLMISEGVGYTVKAIALYGDVLETLREEVETLKEDILAKPYYPRRKLGIGRRIESMYASAGYPDVRAEITEKRDFATGDVVLEAHVVSGPRVRISRIRISGNEKTSASFIRSRLKLLEGDYFSEEFKRDSFRFLYASGLFSRVSIELEKDGERDGRDLLVKVEEKPGREVYVEPGWGSYELFRLGFGFNEKNLFGTGRLLNVESRVNFKGENFQVNFTDPWFLATDITASLPLYYNRRVEPGFTRQEIGSSLLFTKSLTHSLSLTTGYLYRSTDLLSVDANIEAEDAATRYNIGSVSGKLIQDTRDDIFFPSSGYRASLSLELADQFLGGDLNFYRCSFGYKGFREISSLFILAFRYDTGIILPAREQNTIPLAERFFNGGENTVRSFRESKIGPLDTEGDPTGGLAFNVVSVEARRRLTENLSTTFFVDLGNVSPNRSLVEEGATGARSRQELIDTTFSQYFQDLQPGVGVGLQYLLPVGPARLDFALNPDRQSDRGEDDVILHFSLGMAF